MYSVTMRCDSIASRLLGFFWPSAERRRALFLCRLQNFSGHVKFLIFKDVYLGVFAVQVQLDASREKWNCVRFVLSSVFLSDCVMWKLQSSLSSWRILITHFPLFASFAQEFLENLRISYTVFFTECSSVAVPYWTFACFHTRVNCGDSQCF